MLIVIGIGGSYLGARAAIEFVNGQMYNQIRPEGTPEVYFAGNNISSSYLNDLVKIVGDRDFCINVISKSGTTTEPAIAFRELQGAVREANTAARARRSASSPPRTRSAARSSSWRMTRATRPLSCRTTSADRFSVLTPVGLLPMAAAGRRHRRGAWQALRRRRHVSRTAIPPTISLQNTRRFAASCAVQGQVHGDPRQLRAGARHARRMATSSCSMNPRARTIRVCSSPAANFSTDLHSIGQFIQDGTRIMFETVLWVQASRAPRLPSSMTEGGYRRPELSCRSRPCSTSTQKAYRGHADRPYGRRHAEYHHSRLTARMHGISAIWSTFSRRPAAFRVTCSA